MTNCDVAGIDSENLYIHIYNLREIHIHIYSDIQIYIQSIYNLRNIQICQALDIHKTFPPHKMRSGNVDTSYYRYAGYGSSIFTISRILYLYGFSDVIKIFLETGKWDNLSLID